ncbi:MAG: hypothetical protein HY316_04985 [Acidobacteria bacterium]|nr:hypothetical protein [Acidobacteriota bacterium]
MRKKLIAAAAAFTLTGLLVWGQEAMPVSHPLQAHDHDGAEGDAIRSMSSLQMPSNPHLIMTQLRPAKEADLRYADEIVQQLRAALKKYKDYRVAKQDGYQPFLPNLELPLHHFTHVRYGFIGALWFRPAKPTSLLYKKTAKGYELLGAMYTASQFATEAELNRRVPLSVARWHAHINICLPPKSEYQAADWKQFGFQGAIATEQACTEAGGAFYPQMFGWMVHVYPFEKSASKIWAH